MILRRVEGLKELAESYDVVFCDVWGVVHNGVAAYPGAVDALIRFQAERGTVVLVTNAPRPASVIAGQLRRLGVPDSAYAAIVTSGDVTRSLVATRPGAAVFHLGPERDLPFYDGLDVTLTTPDRAELVSCTGLFDDTREGPEDYRDLLFRLHQRGLPMICANPDIVVERGSTLVYCAGALARLYQEIGGAVVLAGKPHAPIYEAAANAAGRGRVLAIGDGLPTDVKGAAAAGIDLLFVTGGIHAADFGAPGAPDPQRVAARLAAEALPAIGFLPALVWDGGAGNNA